MIKLKTLKDLKFISSTLLRKFLSDFEIGEIQEDINNALKQEAIKHTKSCNKKEHEMALECKYRKGHMHPKCEKCQWIKYFFNITKEDLE